MDSICEFSSPNNSHYTLTTEVAVVALSESMWLLSTDRAELHYFHDPESVPGGYAILSHVWEGQEQTFKETEALRKKCAKRKLWWHKTPRDLASPKIRASCIIAARHGYKWIWNDTCCINKKSSAELSEAINSMFRYYSLAKVCYAYLSDVPHAPRPALKDADSLFRKSKWHKRGWTLQELIAPTFLIFLANDWNILGTKMELAELLQDITRVPVEVLRLTQAVHDFSVACRMSWAADRVTTRVEDMAYCLMGIFSITMSTLYGEGDRAFLRLQEEIMKQSLDTSLFVWDDSDSALVGLDCFKEIRCDHTHPQSFLLAQSPKFFLRSTIISFRPTLINLNEIQQMLKVTKLYLNRVTRKLTTSRVEYRSLLVVLPKMIQYRRPPPVLEYAALPTRCHSLSRNMVFAPTFLSSMVRISQLLCWAASMRSRSR